VAPLLAHALGYAALDTDDLVVAYAQRNNPLAKNVPAVFRFAGANGFRAIESQVVIDVARDRNRVVALGGGTLLDARNIALLRASGTIVYLRARPETLVRRLAFDPRSERPLFADAEDRLARTRALLAEREPGFGFAHHVVDVDDKSPEEIAAWIVAAT
jgi:shikimate kinase